MSERYGSYDGDGFALIVVMFILFMIIGTLFLMAVGIKNSDREKRAD